MTGSCEIRQAVLTVRDPAEFVLRIRGIAEATGSRIIFMDADRMAGTDHVRAALRNAFRASAEDRLISRSVEMEALIYAAGSRQVQDAVSFGIHDGINRSYVCICPPSGEACRLLSAMMEWDEGDWEIITPGKACLLMELFGITEAERRAAANATLKDLVIERVALLNAVR